MEIAIKEQLGIWKVCKDKPGERALFFLKQNNNFIGSKLITLLDGESTIQVLSYEMNPLINAFEESISFYDVKNSEAPNPFASYVLLTQRDLITQGVEYERIL